jgi:hypothetical protein
MRLSLMADSLVAVAVASAVGFEDEVALAAGLDAADDVASGALVAIACAGSVARTPGVAGAAEVGAGVGAEAPHAASPAAITTSNPRMSRIGQRRFIGVQGEAGGAKTVGANNTCSRTVFSPAGQAV